MTSYEIGVATIAIQNPSRLTGHQYHSAPISNLLFSTLVWLILTCLFFFFWKVGNAKKNTHTRQLEDGGEESLTFCCGECGRGGLDVEEVNKVKFHLIIFFLFFKIKIIFNIYMKF